MIAFLAVTSPVRAQTQGLIRIQITPNVTTQLSTTEYGALGSAANDDSKFFYGAKTDGGIDIIDGSSGSWTFTPIVSAEAYVYRTLKGFRVGGAGSRTMMAARAAPGGLDYFKEVAGWSNTNMMDTAPRNFSAITVNSNLATDQAWVGPETAGDYRGAGTSGVEGYNNGTITSLKLSGKLYTDLAHGHVVNGDTTDLFYGAGPAGLDFYRGGSGGGDSQINANVYNSITADDGSTTDAGSVHQGDSRNMARTVFGAKAGGGVTKSWNDEASGMWIDNWQTVDLFQAGSVEYSILWKDWADVGSRNDYLYAAGQAGGLWRLDTSDATAPLELLDTSHLITSLVGGRETGVVYAVSIVPEPGSLVVMLIGLVGLMGWRIRRRK